MISKNVVVELTETVKSLFLTAIRSILLAGITYSIGEDGLNRDVVASPEATNTRTCVFDHAAHLVAEGQGNMSSGEHVRATRN
jgi:hypothetical protein